MSRLVRLRSDFGSLRSWIDCFSDVAPCPLIMAVLSPFPSLASEPADAPPLPHSSWIRGPTWLYLAKSSRSTSLPAFPAARARLTIVTDPDPRTRVRFAMAAWPQSTMKSMPL